MKIRYTAGGVVIGPDGRIVIVNQNGNSWSLPKGGIDPGETASQASTREIQEESGITDLTFVAELGSYQRSKIPLDEGPVDDSEIKDITIFLYTTKQTKLAPEDPDNPEALWVHPDEVVNYLTHKKDIQFYESILPTVKKHIKQL